MVTLEGMLHSEVLFQQLQDDGLHASPGAMAIPLHQLHDGVGGHEELVVVGRALEGGCVLVDDIGDLMGRGGGGGGGSFGTTKLNYI